MQFPHVVIARLHEHIEPIDRGNRYEDPLQAALDETQAGQVTGGGSQLNELGGIDHADIEIELANLDAALRIVTETLEKAGALACPMRCMRTSISMPWSARSEWLQGLTATTASSKEMKKPGFSFSAQTPMTCSLASNPSFIGSRSRRMPESSFVTASRI